jgi:ATP-dependent helicase Lhr and Lhr-like helicase
MRDAYGPDDVPSFLDTKGRMLLQEGRNAYGRYQLARTPLAEHGTDVVIFCWFGDRVMDTLLCQLRDRDLPVERDGDCDRGQ